jgi:hypothetical protein
MYVEITVTDCSGNPLTHTVMSVQEALFLKGKLDEAIGQAQHIEEIEATAK